MKNLEFISTSDFDQTGEQFNMKYTNAHTVHKISVNSIPVFSKYTNIVPSHVNVTVDEAEMKSYFNENVKKIFKIGFPTMLFFLCLYLQQTISLSFIGKKYNDQDMINAIGVVNLYINCTLLCFVVGLISGLDTLLANALGSENLGLFGLYISRCRLITYTLSLFLCVFHYLFAIKILSLFNMDNATLKYCNDFLLLSLIYVLLDVQFGINFRVLCIIDKPTASLVVLLLTVILHPVWCYILINQMDLKVFGAGLTLAISQFLNMAMSTLYIYYYKPVNHPNAYACVNKASFQGWWDYLKFTIPSTVMLCAEWLAFEVQAIFAIAISKEDYSVHIFISNIASLMYTLCHGFGMAATVLVGEYIAKGLIKQSKAVAMYCFILAEITMSVCIILLILFRQSVLSVFTDDSNLIQMGKPIIIILAVGEIFDATQSVMASIYRGLGKQKEASIIAFIQFYIVQVFFTWLLAIKLKMGVAGIWYSTLLGNGLTTIVYIYFFLQFDFDKINQETKDRMEKDQKLIHAEETEMKSIS